MGQFVGWMLYGPIHGLRKKTWAKRAICAEKQLCALADQIHFVTFFSFLPCQQFILRGIAYMARLGFNDTKPVS